MLRNPSNAEREPRAHSKISRFCESVKLSIRMRRPVSAKTLSRTGATTLCSKSSRSAQKSSAVSLRKTFGSLFELDIIHVHGSSFLMSGFPPETELNPFVLPGWDRIRSRIEKSQNE